MRISTAGDELHRPLRGNRPRLLRRGPRWVNHRRKPPAISRLDQPHRRTRAARDRSEQAALGFPLGYILSFPSPPPALEHRRRDLMLSASPNNRWIRSVAERPQAARHILPGLPRRGTMCRRDRTPARRRSVRLDGWQLRLCVPAEITSHRPCGSSSALFLRRALRRKGVDYQAKFLAPDRRVPRRHANI